MGWALSMCGLQSILFYILLVLIHIDNLQFVKRVIKFNITTKKEERKNTEKQQYENKIFSRKM